jgi:hypothetical protein
MLPARILVAIIMITVPFEPPRTGVHFTKQQGV